MSTANEWNSEIDSMFNILMSRLENDLEYRARNLPATQTSIAESNRKMESWRNLPDDCLLPFDTMAESNFNDKILSQIRLFLKA